MSSFFLSNANKRKKKNTKLKSSQKKTSGSRKTKVVDEDVGSDFDFESEEQANRDIDYSEDETAQEKRLRLAKEYLIQLENEEKDNRQDISDSEDVVGERLQREVLEKQGNLERKIASSCICPSEDDIKILTGHRLSLTCLCISSNDKYVFSGSKDCSIVKWNLLIGCKEGKIPSGHVKCGNNENHGHIGHVFAIAISSDGKFLASGGQDKLIRIWNPEDLTHIHTFKGHREAVTGLAFRHESNQLFSASKDRTVKIWSLDEMTFVDTLFGHEDGVTAIDCMRSEQAVTSGGRDSSIRLWKVVAESQLVFNGAGGSIDCLRMINEKTFVSGSDDGSLSLWNVTKKKPLYTIHKAHKSGNTDSAYAPRESWTASVASARNTDLIASGSSDSFIRLWRCEDGNKSISSLFSIHMIGFVNALAFSNHGEYLVAGVGQEHRLVMLAGRS
ncbi:U3 small nucleolar RNA-interacting protein 2-like isoform X2 [Xenia sp. Carnegie-2017]|uniref:U3 small nucleolar RNA-interacting protein 2-like isoform X2 n=1 Tax=Xenia sp. Carnegie-2017 TaxID=2897299 RepID=UPI001F04BB2D|nr:U3 small nucleolar RNA-interacting protein 2-like isoform X2 [Xenia sp. Carnegie-2017]